VTRPFPSGRQADADQSARAREWHGLRPRDAAACPRVLAGDECLPTGPGRRVCLCRHRALAHARRWVDLDDRPVVTGEPRGIDAGELADFTRACSELALEVHIDGRSPWDPGRTVLLLIRRATE
jgi:hypothetical protein